jgi:poly-gamma-glutamate capsule biosynthesis protein CapA/YwtB (metallophosphatase superfamily)
MIGQGILKPLFVGCALAVMGATWASGATAATAMASETAEPTVRMAWMGDVMLADGPGRLIARGGDPFKPFAARLAQADIRVANLECVIASGGKALDKPWTFRASPRRVLPVLKRHVDLVSLANNHAGDYGKAAFAEMLTHLQRVGLPYFGGGMDWREAHRPLIIERKGVKIALLGYDEFFPRTFEAGEKLPGVAWSEDEQVVHDIREARKQADVVIPFMHWGQEHEPLANDRQRELARIMIDAGADAVVGAHPHVVQDTETYKGKPIVYSLGNFVFDGFSSIDNNTGWVLWMDVTKQGVKTWRVERARMDKQGTPHPLD